MNNKLIMYNLCPLGYPVNEGINYMAFEKISFINLAI